MGAYQTHNIATTTLVVLLQLVASPNHLFATAFPNNQPTKNTKVSRQSDVSSVSSSSNTEDLVGTSQSLYSPMDWLKARDPLSKKKKCGPCPSDDDEEEDSLEKVLTTLFQSEETTDTQTPQQTASSLLDYSKNGLDRREAAFAMLGTIWATSTTAFSFPEPASAAYGVDAKIELPNMVENMSNRASKQCLVESLGNRECLVWMDPENKLYQGEPY